MAGSLLLDRPNPVDKMGYFKPNYLTQSALVFKPWLLAQSRKGLLTVQISPIAALVLIAWLPFGLYAFQRFPHQRAVVICFIGAWMFLPQNSGFALPGIPDYTKMNATCYSVMLGTLLFAPTRLTQFKPGWLDIPIVCWCVAPLLSSLTNDLGLYDGVAATFDQIVTWGLPYFIGRIYLNNLNGAKELVMGIFIGGLIYVPLCIYEVRMSPQIHRLVYGFTARTGGWAQNIRYGGFRPVVFMDHGLAVGLWMMAVTIITVTLWRAKILKKFWGMPMSLITLIVIGTLIIVKSTGAYFYAAMGIMTMLLANRLKTAALLTAIILLTFLYLNAGVQGTFTGEQADKVVAFAARITNEERAQSLEFRFDNEEILGEHARTQPTFGWGGWGRNRVYNEDGEDITVTDSLWIITFGVNGAFGLFSLFTTMLLPVVGFFTLRYPARTWSNPKVAPAASLAVVVALYMFDCLFNSMVNPIFALGAGGLAGIVMGAPESLRSKPKLSPASTIPPHLLPPTAPVPAPALYAPPRPPLPPRRVLLPNK